MSLRRTAANARGTRGFVLIEVLVAVAVAGIIMAALLRSFSATWSGINAVRENAETMLLARSLLADTARDKLFAGQQNGTLGRYTWTMTTAAAPVAVPVNQPKPGGEQKEANPWILYRVGLFITTPSGRSASLETFRLGQAANQPAK